MYIAPLIAYCSTTNQRTKEPIMLKSLRNTILGLAASAGGAYLFIDLAARVGGVA